MTPIQTFDALPAFNAGSERNYITVTDVPGFAAALDAVRDSAMVRDIHHGREWDGGVTYAEMIDKARDGDLSGVAASDAFLSKLEDISPVSRRWATVAAVAGGAPNVGAYLAGSPMAMRRRTRLATDAAPLTILVDTSSSGGISAAQLIKRGAAVLALVRLLSSLRPVTLYAVCGCQPGRKTSGVAVKIDTTPLDLARAAFMLGHPASSRHGMYTLAYLATRNGDAGGDRSMIRWPHSNVDTYRANGVAFFARAIPGVDPAQTLFMPPVFAHDKAIDNPEKWLRDHLNKYGGQTLADDA